MELTIWAILLSGLGRGIRGQTGVLRDIEMLQGLRRSRQERVLHGEQVLSRRCDHRRKNRGGVEVGEILKGKEMGGLF